MSGLFSDIRGFFDAKYSGRYLALLLRELGRREPVLFGHIMQLPTGICRSLRRGEGQIEHEWRFETKNGTKRIADLAVLSGGQPILLLEVKEDDVKSPTNATQLRDYLSVTTTASIAADRQVRFAHISRYGLPLHDQAMLDKARKIGKLVFQLRYRQIYEQLRKHLKKKSDGPISRLLCEYLEDIDVGTYEVIDIASSKSGKPLTFLLTQVLGFPHSHGLGRLHSDHAVSEFPKLFKILFGNLEAVAEWIKSENRSIFRTRFTRKIMPTPYLDLKDLNRALSKNGGRKANLGRENELPGGLDQYIQSGIVWFYAEGKITNPPGRKRVLGPNDWVYVEVGYGFEISVGDRNTRPSIYVYANFRWSGSGKDPAYKEKKLTAFPSERKALDRLRECLKVAHKVALSKAPEPYRAALRTFAIPPL
jgi:hypothetical protein